MDKQTFKELVVDAVAGQLLEDDLIRDEIKSNVEKVVVERVWGWFEKELNVRLQDYAQECIDRLHQDVVDYYWERK